MTQRLLGRGIEAETLLAYCRSQVGIGRSFSETCRVRGWSRSTAERRWRAAAAQLVAILNRENP